MTLCWRCSTCSLNWPRKDEYKTCVCCKSDCWGASTIPAEEIISEEAAISIKRHMQFEEYCAARDKRQLEEDLIRLTSLRAS